MKMYSRTKRVAVVVSLLISSLFISQNVWAYTTDSIAFSNLANLIRIPVQIKGVTYNFVFDSGAQGTALRSDKAMQMGTNMGVSDTLYDSMNNKSIQDFYLVDELVIGQSHIKNIKTLVFPTSPVFECLGFDGIIGYDIIKQFDWLIDYNALILVKHDTAENYFEQLPDFKRLAFSMNDWQATVQLSLGDTAVSFLFDSGASTSDINEASYSHIKTSIVTEIKQIIEFSGANTEARKDSGAVLQFNTKPFPNTAFMFPAKFNRTAISCNKIGNMFWAKNQVFLSEGKQILAFKPSNTRPYASFGVQFRCKNQEITIKSLEFNDEVKKKVCRWATV